jgi:hypothetical protein
MPTRVEGLRKITAGRASRRRPAEPRTFRPSAPHSQLLSTSSRQHGGRHAVWAGCEEGKEGESRGTLRAEPPGNSVSQHGSKNLGTPLHSRGDDDEESSGKNMRKKPPCGTKKPQAGGWPKKRLKKGGNVTHLADTAQCTRLMCVFSEISVVPLIKVLRVLMRYTQPKDIQEPFLKKYRGRASRGKFYT